MKYYFQKNIKCTFSDKVSKMICACNYFAKVKDVLQWRTVKMELTYFLTNNNRIYVLWLIGCATQYAVVYSALYHRVS